MNIYRTKINQARLTFLKDTVSNFKKNVKKYQLIEKKKKKKKIKFVKFWINSTQQTGNTCMFWVGKTDKLPFKAIK